jgi:hypothetical protein
LHLILQGPDILCVSLPDVRCSIMKNARVATKAAPATAGAHDSEAPAPDGFVVEFVTEGGVPGKVKLTDAYAGRRRCCE